MQKEKFSKQNNLHKFVGGLCALLLVVGMVVFIQCTFECTTLAWRYYTLNGMSAYQAFWTTAATTAVFVVGGFALLSAVGWLIYKVFFLNKWRSA